MMTPIPPSPISYSAAIRTPPDTVDDAHDFLRDVWARHPEIPGVDRMSLETVVSELITNVIQFNPDRQVLCEIELRISPHEFLLRTTDSGDRLDPPPQPRAMPTSFAESGRGLALIQLLTDKADYRWRGGRNLWTLRRYRDAAKG